jgi:hypothetical protein
LKIRNERSSNKEKLAFETPKKAGFGGNEQKVEKTHPELLFLASSVHRNNVDITKGQY